MTSAREQTESRSRMDTLARGPEVGPDCRPPRHSRSEPTPAGLTASALSSHPAPGTQDTNSLMESLALSAMEIINGGRDLDKIARWLTESVYASLSLRRTIAQQSRQAAGTAARREPMYSGRTRASSPHPGVVEGVTMVHTRLRTRAVAVRLEKTGNRWIATHLTVL